MPARRVSVSVGVLKMETKPIKAAVKGVKSEQKSLSKSFKAMERRLEASNRLVAGYRAQVVGLTRALNGMRRSQRETAMTLAKMTGGFLTLTTAVYAVGRVLTSGFREAIRYDRGLTLIRKTTKLAESELRTLSGTIMHLSSTLGVDRNVIAGAAGIAGRLGVNEVAQLEVLSEIATKLDKATNVDAARATQALAKVLTLTGRKAGNFAAEMRKAGDALVHLGNNAPVAEDHILNLAVPLAAVIGRFGGAPEDVLATATALAVAEGQAQGAATAYQKLMTNVSVLTQQGGPAFDRFARVMGRSTDQLKMDLDKNIVATLLELLETLKEFDAVSQINILRDIGGIQDLRSQQALLKSIPHLAEAYDLAYNAKDQLELEDQIRRARLSGQWDVYYQKAANTIKEDADKAANAMVMLFKAATIAGTTAYEHFKEQTSRILVPMHRAWFGAKKAYDEWLHDVTPDDLRAIRGNVDATERDAHGFQRRVISEDVAAAIKQIVDPHGNVPGTRQPVPMDSGVAIQRLLKLNEEFREDRRLNDLFGESALSRTEAQIAAEIKKHVDFATANYAALRPDPAGLRLYGPAGASTGRLMSAAQIAGAGKRHYGVPMDDVPMNAHQLKVFDSRVARRLAEIELQRRGPATQQYGPNAYGIIRKKQADRLDAAYEKDREEEEEAAERAEAEAARAERERQHAIDMEVLRREARDTRRLTAMLRRGESAEAVAHQEQVLALDRQYYRAREELTGRALEAELARIEHHREQIKKGDDKARESEALADRLTNRVADILREGGSIKDAWKGLMNELAADLLEKGIMEPFKKAMKNLLLEVIGYATAGSARGGSYGVLDRIGGGIMALVGGGGPGGYGSSGSYTTSSGGIPGLARGGRVIGAGMALVGERGPELLSLAPPASVVPLSGGSGAVGGVTFVNNWNIQSEDRVAVKRAIQEELPAIAEYNRRQLESQSTGNSRYARSIRR